MVNEISNIILYGECYKNGKRHLEIIKSDFDIIRELNKLHKKTIDFRNTRALNHNMLTLMCSYFHGQPYK